MLDLNANKRVAGVCFFLFQKPTVSVCFQSCHVAGALYLFCES